MTKVEDILKGLRGRYFCRATFGISAGELAVWQASFMLDEAALQLPGSTALDTACQALLGATFSPLTATALNLHAVA